MSARSFSGLASSARLGAANSPKDRAANSDAIFGAFLIPGSFLFVGTHDPKKADTGFPRDKRGTRLRGDHAQSKEILAGFRRPVNSAVPLRRLNRWCTARSKSRESGHGHR